MRIHRQLLVALTLFASASLGVAACGSSDSPEEVAGGGGNEQDASVSDGGGNGGSSNQTDASDEGNNSFLDADLGDTHQTPDGFDPDAACAATTVAGKRIPANLLFVLDRSGSMNCNPPPTQTTAECEASPHKKDTSKPSKWEITRDALKTAWTNLQQTNPVPAVGIMLFNNNQDGKDGKPFCGYPDTPDIDVANLDDLQLTGLNSKLANTTPKGATPIIGSVSTGYNYLLSSSLPGNKFIVLLTDGAETCAPSKKSQLVSMAEQAAKSGIRTFVLGAPGSESERAFLSQLAFAGGTPSSPGCDHSGSQPDVGDCHMDMTNPNLDFASELTKNLQAISLEAVSCVLDVPEPGPNDPPVDPNKVNVVYTDGNGDKHDILQDNNKACDDDANQGWQYSDDKKQIILCGSACTTLKGDPNGTVSIELGCQTHVAPK